MALKLISCYLAPVTLFLTMNCSLVCAQSIALNYKPLKVGDKIPTYKFINLINYPSKTALSSEFTGKLLILDFWSTGCASCIESWPKLERLQKEFDGEIQILLVNAWQSENIVKRLIEKRRMAGIVDLSLPTVCRDSVITKLFPIDGVPFVAWVGRNGVLLGITDGSQITEKNIRTILSDETKTLEQKVNRKLLNTVNVQKPLFVNQEFQLDNRLLNQSLLTKYIRGLPTSSAVFADSSTGYGIYSSQALDGLYRLAYSDRTDMFGNITALQSNRLILQTKDENKHLFVVDGAMQIDNLFTYQLLSDKPRSVKDLQEIMQVDLARFFGFRVKWERRTMKCLVLTATDTSLIIYRGGPTECTITDIMLKVNGVSITQMIKWMEDGTRYNSTPFPIIDETGYKGYISIHLDGVDVYDIKSLGQALAKYKMQLKLEDRHVNVLVVSEISFPN